MENPFKYGAVATGEYFTDREEELADLELEMRSGQDVAIISPRRYGKTSLLFQAMSHLRSEQMLVAYLDLLKTATKEQLVDHLATAIYNNLVAPVELAWQKAIGLFFKLPIRPKMTINPDSTPSFEFSAGGRSRDLDRTLEDLLALPGKISSSRKRKVALVLDEFQEVVTIDPHLPALMRAIFQTQGDVCHVFAGSKRHLMQRVFTDENEPMYRMARIMALREIPKSAFAAFIQDRFNKTGQRITEEAIQMMLDITGCHPHDTQELCHFTWALAAIEKAEVTRDLVVRALEKVLDAEDARYTDRWEKLSAHQRLTLVAVANDGDASIYSEAYRRQHHLGAASTVQKAVSRLIDEEMMEASPKGGYRVSDPFFRTWLLRMSSC